MSNNTPYCGCLCVSVPCKARNTEVSAYSRRLRSQKWLTPVRRQQNEARVWHAFSQLPFSQIPQKHFQTQEKCSPALAFPPVLLPPPSLTSRNKKQEVQAVLGSARAEAGYWEPFIWGIHPLYIQPISYLPEAKPEPQTLPILRSRSGLGSRWYSCCYQHILVVTSCETWEHNTSWMNSNLSPIITQDLVPPSQERS